MTIKCKLYYQTEIKHLQSIITKTQEEPEQFNPTTFDVNSTAKFLLKFINDQELTQDEANPAIAK
jgi:hypothetical protein